MTRASLDGNPNVPTSARASEVTANSANAPTPTVAERLRADAVGTAAVDAQATPAGIAAREIMTRAGLQRAASGQTTVQDSASIGRSAEVAGLNAREQIYGSQSALLNPPSAPFVEFTNNTRVGATSFAQNIGSATDNFLIRRMDSTGRPELYRDLNQLSPDQLLAAFLKINITDPNDNPATQNKLYEISTEMRQLAIVEAKKKIETAREQQKEAEAYAQQAQYISQVVQVVSIAMAVFTMGSSLAAAGALQAGVSAGTAAATTTLSNAALSEGAKAVAQEAFKEAIREGATTQVAKQVAEQAALQFLEAQGVTGLAAQQMATQAANNALIQQVGQTAMQNALANGATPEAAKQAAVKAMAETQAQILQEGARASLQSIQAGAPDAFAQQMTTQVTSQMPNATATQIQAQVQANLTSLANAPTSAVSSMVCSAWQAAPATMPSAVANVCGSQAAAQTAVNAAAPNLLGQAMTANSLTSPGMRMASTAVSAGGQVADASAQAKLADMQLQARQTELEARRWELVGDQAQAQVESSAQVINTMMQSRNQVIDNVLQMSQNQHVASMRIQSAGMSR